MSQPPDIPRKKSTWKHSSSDGNQSVASRVVSDNALQFITNARERIIKQREVESKRHSIKADYGSAISLAFDKPSANKAVAGKFGSMFGNLVAGAAGLSTKTAASSFLDMEMSDHATSIKEQYMLMCLQQRTNPKSSLVKLISTFGKQHSHNLNFTGYGFSDADFDAATIVFQNLTSLSLRLLK